MDGFLTKTHAIITSLLLLGVFMLGTGISQVQAVESLFGDGPSPLPVEEAFASEVGRVTADEVAIHFDVADGYYLYQKKMSFSSDNPAIVLGTPVYPPPLIHEDEYFGKSDVHRGSTTMLVPLTNNSTQNDFVITVGFQGCADIGLCYPPTETDFKVALPAKPKTTSDKDTLATSAASGSAAPKLDLATNNATTQNSAAPGKLDLNALLKKSADFNSSDSPLLKPDEAFVPSIVSADDQHINVQWLIQPGYYLYRDKISFTLTEAGGATVAGFDIDRGVMQNDPYFGDVEILREVVGARIKLAGATNISNAMLQISSQGCADIGVCFPPETTSLPVAFSNTGDTVIAAAAPSSSNTTGSASLSQATPAEATPQVNAAVQPNNAITSAANEPTGAVTTGSSNAALPVTEQDTLTRLLEAGNLGFIALTFYGAGLLLAFTACMYPMIPILSSLIVGQGAKLSTTKAFSLSLVYVMSMASVFAVVGILVGLSGYNIQPLFQNPWVLSAFAGLFVLLALSMFGLFQLQMPSAIQSKVSEISNKQQGGSFTGVAVMGMLSALIVGPCVTPPLVAALAYIAKTGDATIGGIALFAIGIGMGTPLLFIGTSLGRFMPKAGGWMETTQRIFGVVLLAVAIYLVSRFLPGNVIMFMFAMLAIFTGVFFGATDRLDGESRGTQRLGKSVGLVALVYGVVLMVGALAGNTSMLSPLKGIVGQQASSAGAGTNEEHISFKRIKTLTDLNNEIAAATAQQRPVMLDFYADWCVSCKEMEAFTFPDSRVKEQLADAVLIQADVTKNDADDQSLLKEFDLFGPPAIILYDRNGKELTAGRVVGYMQAEPFSQHLQAYLNQ